MGICERVHHVAEDPHRLPDRELVVVREPGAQRLALNVGHDVVQQVTRGPRGEERHDVGVLELGREVDLALEAVDTYAGRQLGRQDLHDHRALEPHLFGEEDAAHPAAAELALNGVGSAEVGLQLLAELGRHAPS